MSASEPLKTSVRRRVLVVLCVTEITSWGVLYYAFAVVAPAITRDTGWPTSGVTAAFSAALIVSALLGVPVGRWLDRAGPRGVMTAGSALAVPAVAGVAVAPTLPWFLAAWTLAGVAMAGILYAPAFAALTRWWGPQRVQALTALTLLAGLSSTVFAPLTAALLEHLGWRGAYLALAAILALTVPAHLLGLRAPWPHHAHGPEATGPAPTGVTRSRPFLLLTTAVAIGAFSVYAVIVNQVPLLLARGLSTGTAALALGLGGVGQVLGRLGYPRLTAATGPRGRAVMVMLLAAAATGLLAILPGPGAALVASAMLVGATRGVFTLLQATAITDRWGPAHYGRLNGLLSAPATIAAALAPWAGATLAPTLGGYPRLFGLLAGLAALAAAVAAGSAMPDQRGTCAGPNPRR